MIVQSVVDHAIVTVDQNGIIQSWSEGAHRVLRLDGRRGAGQSADCIYTPEDVAGDVPHAERQRAATEATVTSNRWHLRKDGRPIWASCVMAPLRARGGTGQGFILVLRDLTVEKTQQDAMERTNAWLEREVTLRTGALTEANRRGCAEIEERQQAEAALRQVQRWRRSASSAAASPRLQQHADGRAGIDRGPEEGPAGRREGTASPRRSGHAGRDPRPLRSPTACWPSPAGSRATRSRPA